MGNSCFTSQPEVVPISTGTKKKKSKSDIKGNKEAKRGNKKSNKNVANTTGGSRSEQHQLSSPPNATIASTVESSIYGPNQVPDFVNGNNGVGSQNNTSSKASAHTKAFMASGGEYPVPSNSNGVYDQSTNNANKQSMQHSSSIGLEKAIFPNNNNNFMSSYSAHGTPITAVQSSLLSPENRVVITTHENSFINGPAAANTLLPNSLNAPFSNNRNSTTLPPTSSNGLPNSQYQQPMYPSTRSSFHAPSGTNLVANNGEISNDHDFHVNIAPIASEPRPPIESQGITEGGHGAIDPNNLVATPTLPQLPRYNPRAIRKPGGSPALALTQRLDADSNLLDNSNTSLNASPRQTINTTTAISNPFLPPSSFPNQAAHVHLGVHSNNNLGNEDSYGPSPLGALVHHNQNYNPNQHGHPNWSPTASTATPSSTHLSPAGTLVGGGPQKSGKQPLPLNGTPSASPSGSTALSSNTVVSQGSNVNYNSSGLPPLPPPLLANTGTALNSLSTATGMKSSSPTTTVATTVAGLSSSRTLNNNNTNSYGSHQHLNNNNNLTNSSAHIKPSPSSKGLYGRAYSTDSTFTGGDVSQRNASNGTWAASGVWAAGTNGPAESGSLVSFATVGRNATLYGSHYTGGAGNDNASVTGSISIFGGHYPKSSAGETDGGGSQFGGKGSKKLNFTDDKNDDDDDELDRSFASSTKSGTSSIGSARNAINRNEEDPIYNDRRVSDVASRISRDPTSQVSALGAAARATDEFILQQQRRQAEAWALAEQMQVEMEEEDLRSQATGSQVDSSYREQQQQKQKLLVQQAQQNALTIDQQERLMIQRNALLMAQQEAIEEQLVIDFIVGEPKESATHAGSGLSRQLSSASSMHRDRNGLIASQTTSSSSPSSALLNKLSGGSPSSALVNKLSGGGGVATREGYGGLFGSLNHSQMSAGAQRPNNSNIGSGGSLGNSMGDRPMIHFSPPIGANTNKITPTTPLNPQQPSQPTVQPGPPQQTPIKTLFGSGHTGSKQNNNSNKNPNNTVQTGAAIGQVLRAGSPTAATKGVTSPPSSRGGALSPPSGSSSSRSPASRRVQASSPATSLPFNLPPTATSPSPPVGTNMLLMNSTGSAGVMPQIPQW